MLTRALLRELIIIDADFHDFQGLFLMKYYWCSVFIISWFLFSAGVFASDRQRVAKVGPQAHIQAGLYKVDVRLLLPFLDDKTGHQTVSVCIRNTTDKLVDEFNVLSRNTPFGHCLKREIVQTRNKLSFRYQCKDRGAATADAEFELNGTSFVGKISMKMGGKNMTMTELQSGRKTGEC